MAITDLDLSTRLLLSAAGPVLVVAWVWYVVAAAGPGAARLARVVPLLPALFFFSSLFRLDDPNESVLQIMASHIYLWMVPSKILCFAMNRGQLVKSHDCGNSTAFALAMLGLLTIAFEEKPVAHKEGTKTEKRRAYKDVRFNVIQLEGKAFLLEAMRLMTEIVVKIGVSFFMRKWHSVFTDSGHFFLRDVCLVWFAYTTTSAVHDAYALLILLPTSLKLAPSFDYPFLAQSMQELWSRRYSLVMGECLRDLIYDPICEGCWVRGSVYYKKVRPPKMRRAIGTILTFAFSGLIHSAVLRYLSQEALFVRSGFFFVACSFLIVMEAAIKHFIQSSSVLKSLVRLVPSWIWMVSTFLTVSYMTHLFFWPDFYKAGFDAIVLDGFLRLLNIV